MGLFFEWLLTFRHGFEIRDKIKTTQGTPLLSSEEEAANVNADTELTETKRRNVHYMVAALLHVVQLSIGYFLILIIMTYNVGLVIAILAGCGLGYFLFARLRRDTMATITGRYA
eukprot:TRINITY_DN25059_c0_g1_i1.p1 TRINITY_DN25059_c0_g1~~TRINITY_DN25059_c0_g1_i1.p1  ORF type:complete len:115 (-),score=7.79 TRINITY_DN25059_c0_g1_i1:41-385(-)